MANRCTVVYCSALRIFRPGKGKNMLNIIEELMNGLGICGTLDGCNLFLQFIKTILEKDGQVLADSTDLASFYDDGEEIDYSTDRYYGETEFVMKYRGIRSDPFNWIYIDFKTLEALAAINGLQCEQITTGRSGNYLARIF
jgi:hypothetical protein